MTVSQQTPLGLETDWSAGESALGNLCGNVTIFLFNNKLKVRGCLYIAWHLSYHKLDSFSGRVRDELFDSP